MERCDVILRVFEPLEIEFARDELIGNIVGNKITYTNKEYKFYKKDGTQYDDDLSLSAIWEISSWKTLDKRKFYHGHNSFINTYYLRKRVYSNYICPYYKIEKDYIGKTYDSIVKPKYKESKIVPLNVLWTKKFPFHEEFINSYWHHPRKEMVTNNLDEAIEYFRKWLSVYYWDKCNSEWKDCVIENINYYMAKKDALISVYWED